MRTSFVVIAALFASSSALKVEQENSAVGIFSKLMEQQEAQSAAETELKEAREAKRIQLIEAEKEHEQAVADEEKEDADKAEKEQEAMEQRMNEKKRADQIKAHEALFKQVMDEQNLQMDGNVRMMPRRRRNPDHAADLMLINLSADDDVAAPAEPAAEDAKKADAPAEESKAAPAAKKAEPVEPYTGPVPPVELHKMRGFKWLENKPVVVDPRFATGTEDLNDQVPSLNSPADIMPYWRAVEDVQRDKMPGSRDLAVPKQGAERLPDSMLPKYDTDAKPKWHARPIKSGLNYEEPLQKAPITMPVFDKSGKLADPEAVADQLVKTQPTNGKKTKGAKKTTTEEQVDGVVDKKTSGTSTKKEEVAAPAEATPEAVAKPTEQAPAAPATTSSPEGKDAAQ